MYSNKNRRHIEQEADHRITYNAISDLDPERLSSHFYLVRAPIGTVEMVMVLSPVIDVHYVPWHASTTAHDTATAAMRT